MLAAGLLFALLDHEPLAAIVVAQAANGLLLPVATLFLLVAMNDREILGEWVNGRAANLAGGALGACPSIGPAQADTRTGS